MSLAGLDPSLLGPACLAGLLVLATHVPLGMRVLARGIVFIDLAIAQVAGLGVMAADALGWEGAWAVQGAAVTAALAGACLLTWSERRWPEMQEALIGVLFVLASCAGILILAGNPHGGEQLRDLLVGQILWVSLEQLVPVAFLSAGVLVLWFCAGGRLGSLGFHGLFALAVTASVQLVGVYLVFASLILPALATRGLVGRGRLAAAYGVGVVALVVGLGLSALLDLPSGAVIVLTMAVVAGGAAGAMGSRRRLPPVCAPREPAG